MIIRSEHSESTALDRGGNKRTGFVDGILFLELHGFDFKATEEDATQAICDLAAGRLDEAAYAGWLRINVKRKRGR